MPSPFPGMDPYLEPHWLDVHSSLVTSSRNVLNERLPEDLIARVEERIAVESDADHLRRIAPDTRIFEAVGAAPAVASDTTAGVALAPYRLVLLADPITERFIEIIDPTGDRLVTVIEFVSPTNKRGEGIRAFVEKREELLAGGVSMVEIDLTRAGDWRALLRPHLCPTNVLSAYRATIRVPSEPRTLYLQPISLREPLPTLRIPLRENESPVELSLQPLLEQAYQNGRYARTMDYSRPPNPPLEAEDTAWAETVLGKAAIN